jgi:hypothetical protein
VDIQCLKVIFSLGFSEINFPAWFTAKQVGLAVIFLISMWDVPGLNLSPEVSCPDRFICGFPQFLQGKCQDSTSVMTTSFIIH